MAKITKFQFGYTAGSGDKYRFDGDVFATADGRFEIAIPADLEDTAFTFLRGPRGFEFGHSKLDRPKGKPARISSDTMKNAEQTVRAIVTDHMSSEVVKERVLIYRYETGVHYAKGADGRISPNGYPPDNTGQAGWEHVWKGPKTVFSNERKPLYSLKFMAMAMVKTTATRKDSVKITYQRDELGGHGTYDNYGQRLNAFIGLEHPTGEDWRGCRVEDYKQIPYTEEAARFLYETMLSFCRIDDRLKDFFGDDSKVQAAIAAGGTVNLLK